jgi:hypothetical protein
MNPTTLLAAILALLTGAAGGAAITQTSNNKAANSSQQSAEESVLPEDFLSVRPALENLPTESISDIERTDLLFTREEEKLARDVYLTLYEQWNLRIFSNIAQSEQTHTEAVRDLLVKYQIPDPVTDDTTGVFVDPELQSLYSTLVSKGLTSEVDALEVGMMIEEMDIVDLQEAIDNTDNDDIALVYENLLRGSRNHLRSFTRQLENRQAAYEPQYISDEDFQSIVSSGPERGTPSRRAGRNRE